MLAKIVETKRDEVAQLKASTTMAALLDAARQASPARGFRRALLESPRPVSVIAEVKKASPSKGVIRPAFDPLAIAQAYRQAGAEAISVLTDRTYFQGDLLYLRQVRKSVDRPLLRKDFLIDEWQVVESRAAGADCILLIAAILEGEALRHFSQVAQSLGMDVLIEVHDEAELEKTLTHTTPSLLGINNRDLRTFTTSLAVTERLMGLVPPEIPVVSESGISAPADIAFVRSVGARSVLVGEHFMRQADVARAVLELVGEQVPTALGGQP